VKDLVRPMSRSITSDGESVSAVFRANKVRGIFAEANIELRPEGVVLPASDVPIALIDSETGRVVHAPWPRSWPRLVRADQPNPPAWEGKRPDDEEAPKVPDYRFRDPGAADFAAQEPDGDDPLMALLRRVRSANRGRASEVRKPMIESAVMARAAGSRMYESADAQNDSLRKQEARMLQVGVDISAVQDDLAKPNLRQPRKGELEQRHAVLLKEQDDLAEAIARLAVSETVTRQAGDAAMQQADTLEQALDRSYDIDWAAQIEHAVSQPSGTTTGKEH
jgi:hypothetical protein